MVFESIVGARYTFHYTFDGPSLWVVWILGQLARGIRATLIRFNIFCLGCSTIYEHLPSTISLDASATCPELLYL